MTKPTEPSVGRHNADLASACDRLHRGGTYRDLSTICVIPTRGLIPAKIVQSWWGLMTPMNQKFLRIFVENMEVGDAYNWAIEQILGNADLAKWKYVLTLEEDNMVQPDSLMKAFESMAKFDVVGGLYWTKGEGGQPMIFGDPNVMPKNFIPQFPRPESLQPCNGLAMGFTLFKLDMFKKLPKPWFKTCQDFTPGQGVRMETQDLYFFENAAKFGYKFACDTRIRIGHYDHSTGIVW